MHTSASGMLVPTIEKIPPVNEPVIQMGVTHARIIVLCPKCKEPINVWYPREESYWEIGIKPDSDRININSGNKDSDISAGNIEISK